MNAFTFPQKFLAISILAVSCFLTSLNQAQTIQIDSTFISDGEVFPFGPNDSIYGLSISGSVTLSSDTSLVRVILTDNSGNEWMVYESYPLISPRWELEISEVADETMYLHIYHPNSLKIQLINASIDFDSITLQSSYTENLVSLQLNFKEMIESRKVDSMNYVIESNHMLWFANQNPVSDLSYADKLERFGEKYNLLGLDYYSGGIYDGIPGDNGPTDDSELIDSWDWRNRHGANDPTKTNYYYDGDPYGGGWMTSVSNQMDYNCRGLCYIYGPIAAIEGAANLYLNYHKDYNLSEQHVLDCDNFQGNIECEGGGITTTFNFAKDYGVLDSMCYPRDNTHGYCRQNEPIVDTAKSYRVKIGGSQTIYYTAPDSIKKELILHGPIALALTNYPSSGWSHIMALVGYGIIKIGDTIYGGQYIHNTYFVIDSNSAYIGDLFWVYKNSYGSGWGDNGFAYHLNSYSFYMPKYCVLPIYDILPNTDSITPLDKDKDGYWNWGISAEYGLPDGACSDLKDSDDSENRLGPFDSNYYSVPVMPEIVVTRSLMNADTINNGGYYFFEGDTASDINMNFYISNPGTAQLNLRQYNLTGEGDVSIDYQNHPGQYELTRPDTNIVCMNNHWIEYKIKLKQGALPGTLAHIHIYLGELEFDSTFEYTMVFNGCETSQGYDSIETDVTWADSYRSQLKDVHIKMNGELTVTGTVILSPDADIIVERGGKLIIDGGKLTNSCDDQLWSGIQVWGDSSLSQYPYSNQGCLDIKNNGCIEYAKTAVFVGKNVSGNPYYAFSGGIIRAEDALFLNNEVDVEFLPFINDHPFGGGELFNFSVFMDCTFKTYDPEFVLPKPIAHVILDGVNGIVFYSCSFRTQEVPNYPIEVADRGIGILAYDAQVFVKGTCTNAIIPCNNYDSSYFENLRYGIKAFNTGGNKYFHVSEAVFDSNVAGIYLSGYHQSLIASSFFSSYLENEQIPGLEDPFFGCIYLDGSTGYYIAKNHFAGPFISVPEEGSIAKIGIYVKDSGEEDNEIYNNLFTGLEAGIVAEGINKGDRAGLCLKCNDFHTCLNDILVIPDPYNKGGKYIGIKENQGADSTLSSALAGNTFTPEVQGRQAIDNGGNRKYNWSYFNMADHINYYHHDINMNYVTYPSDSNYTNETITLHNQYVLYEKEYACPSGLNNNQYKSGVDPWLEIAEAYAQLFPLQNAYNSLLDGGNTEELDFDIISSVPDEALELRQQLLDDSPYLSDTIMKKAIYKENVLPNAMIRDVLSANPQSAKSAEILEAVANRYDPMPDYMMAEIMQGNDQIGALEILESKMGYWEQYRSRAVNRLIREYMTDSTIIDREDSLINLFQDESDLQSKYRLAFSYLENNQEEQATNTLSDIPSDFELSTLEQDIHQEYLDYFDILQMMKDSSLNARQLDSSSVQSLVAIMNSNLPPVNTYARGLLVKGRHIDYTETVSFPAEVKSYPAYYYLDPKKIDFPDKDNLILFPNPSGDFVVAYFNTLEQGRKGTIMVNDVQGKEIDLLLLNSMQNQVILNLSGYPNGIYIIYLSVDNKLISSKLLLKGRK